jgi:ubiquinol-cytochrome c reductase cytochrome c1 subunit
LWDLQGVRTAKFEEVKDAHDPTKTHLEFTGFEQVTPGKMTPLEYDNAVADLVGFLQWMGEPQQHNRKQLGVWVLLFLGLLATLAWRLNASYWKEVK